MRPKVVVPDALREQAATSGTVDVLVGVGVSAMACDSFTTVAASGVPPHRPCPWDACYPSL